MDGQETPKATKHLRQDVPVDVDNTSITLSPELRGALSRIEKVVEDSPHFDEGIKTNLKDYASGKPFSSIRMALSGVATITQETMKHINATGDRRAQEALDDFISRFDKEEERGTPSFKLVPNRAQAR